MGQPYVGEIRIFGFNFAPRGWAFCDGTLLSIQQYAPLFSILGTVYGGNGTTNFGLPNFQGRAPMHWGTGPGLTARSLGELDGEQTVTLLNNQLPSHTHILSGASPNPANAPQQVAMPSPSTYLSVSQPNQVYSDVTAPVVALSPSAISPSGGSQPHNNVQPILTLNFCIALVGVFPARN